MCYEVEQRLSSLGDHPSPAYVCKYDLSWVCDFPEVAINIKVTD